MFFISGITGRVGASAAKRLLDQGASLRALVRDPQKASAWQKEGVDVRPGDLTDPHALKACLDGLEGAFLMQPTPFGVSADFPEARTINASIHQALSASNVKKVVVLSSVGSDKPHGLGNIMQTRLLEETLADIRLPIAYIRAAAFIENSLHGLTQAAETGYFDSFLQPTDRMFPMVAIEDIGQEVARLLTADWNDRLIVELGSRFSPQNLAEAMSEVLEKPVQARAIPRESWNDVLRAMGLPQDKVGPWAEMQDGFNSGWIDFGREGTVSVASTTTPVEVFRRATQSE